MIVMFRGQSLRRHLLDMGILWSPHTRSRAVDDYITVYWGDGVAIKVNLYLPYEVSKEFWASENASVQEFRKNIEWATCWIYWIEDTNSARSFVFALGGEYLNFPLTTDVK